LLFDQLGDGGAEVGGVEAEGAGLAFEDDAALLIDEVETVGPAGVGGLGGVVEVIEDGGKFDAELADARVGDFAALVEVAGAGEDDVIFNIALHLPDVAGMRFENVNGEEADAVVVVVVELVEGRNLPPVGRSGVAAEDEDDRLLCVERRELDARGFVEGQEIEVGCGIAGVEAAGTGAHPHGLEGGDEEDGRDGHVHHDLAEFLGRLLHGPEDVAGEDDPDYKKDRDRAQEYAAESGFFRGIHPHEWGNRTRLGGEEALVFFNYGEMDLKVRIFRSAVEFRAWLEEHHADVAELWVGFYNQRTSKKSITYREALDEALCFRWINGVRRSVDATTYTNRFTPRKVDSRWSTVNVKRMQGLMAAGRVSRAGLTAFERRRTGVEIKRVEKLSAAQGKIFREDAKAWEFFRKQAPWYQRTASVWVQSAKQETTRLRRLRILIEDSNCGRRLAVLSGKEKGS